MLAKRVWSCVKPQRCNAVVLLSILVVRLKRADFLQRSYRDYVAVAHVLGKSWMVAGRVPPPRTFQVLKPPSNNTIDYVTDRRQIKFSASDNRPIG